MSCFAIAGAAVAAAFVLAASAAPNLPRLADKSPNAIAVDVELVIAVDVSYSMDPDEQALQREGYVMALTSREFMQALREGVNGRIAITYFEWASHFDQKIIMPWRLIEGPESADAPSDGEWRLSSGICKAFTACLRQGRSRAAGPLGPAKAPPAFFRVQIPVLY